MADMPDAMFRSSISPGARLLLARLWAYASAREATAARNGAAPPFVFPSTGLLADEVASPPRTVRAWLEELREWGAIVETQREHHGRTRHGWELAQNPLPAPRASGSRRKAKGRPSRNMAAGCHVSGAAIGGNTAVHCRETRQPVATNTAVNCRETRQPVATESSGNPHEAPAEAMRAAGVASLTAEQGDPLAAELVSAGHDPARVTAELADLRARMPSARPERLAEMARENLTAKRENARPRPRAARTAATAAEGPRTVPDVDRYGTPIRLPDGDPWGDSDHQYYDEGRHFLPDAPPGQPRWGPKPGGGAPRVVAPYSEGPPMPLADMVREAAARLRVAEHDEHGAAHADPGEPSA